jgi:hypothetical protein
LRRILALISVTAMMLALTAMPALAQTQQDGLVNVNIENVLNDNVITIQLPIAVAANVCGVEVDVLTDEEATQEGGADCDAAAGSRAQNTNR